MDLQRITLSVKVKEETRMAAGKLAPLPSWGHIAQIPGHALRWFRHNQSNQPIARTTATLQHFTAVVKPITNQSGSDLPPAWEPNPRRPIHSPSLHQEIRIVRPRMQARGQRGQCAAHPRDISDSRLLLRWRRRRRRHWW